MENSVKQLQDKLLELPVYMRTFSLSMRSLYADKSVSSSVKNGVEFIRLRDETRDDAVIYMNHIMPITKQCVGYLQEYFGYYEGLNFDQWKTNLSDIIEEIITFKQECHVLVKLHESQLSELKKKADRATIIIKTFKGLESKYENDIKKLKAKSNIKNSFALGLLFIPLVGAIASPILFGTAASDRADVIAKCEHHSIELAATAVVRSILVPALENFISGLEIISGFFESVEEELKQIKRKGDCAIKNLDDIEDGNHHYILMKNTAGEIKRECKRFHECLPAIRSDFMAIPLEGTDQNYVDEWLLQQKQIIRENCNERLLINIFKLLGVTENA